ncbi:MAG: DUF1611 domain-containing protein [Elusimicrobiota bacterium]
MTGFPEGRAVVYCQGAFATPNGKTAHGLVRFTRRYEVLSVVDGSCAGRDAGVVLDGRHRGIPVLATLEEALKHGKDAGRPATHLVVGLAPDGGRLPPSAKDDMAAAIRAGLHVDSGLHDFLSEDPLLSRLAAERGVRIRDVRKPPSRNELSSFSGRIRQVRAPRLAVLGTDSALGKRTTAVLLTEALRGLGCNAEFIGTGQTSWLQGARHCIVLDSIINDFVAGEIERVVCLADERENPDVIVIEGQGSLLNPAYPGGFEILAAARPELIVLQHAPARTHYDGFPDCPMDPLDRQIQAVELIGRRPPAAITLNHEGLDEGRIPAVCEDISRRTGLPVFDVLLQGAQPLARRILSEAKSLCRPSA